jgi:hypothetical protein
VIADPFRLRLQRGEVRSRGHFGIALAPEILAGEDPGQVAFALRRGTHGDE